ncbi:glycosyltransferase family 2 protein [Escherichia albertii]|uniref:glycosyltransferase family 2 protein n=1 Tax=Escherichia albertii TaxID=208962 RepID=UPI0030C917B2
MDSLKKLITVCVITYNSDKTIIDTLESIKRQTYGTKFIELIIADDCSNDDTLAIMKEWVKINKCIFSHVEIIEQKQNIGLTKNINSAWKLSKGSWVKSIAGDDILLENCISDNVHYVNKNGIKSVVFSLMRSFSEYNNDITEHDDYPSTFQQKILDGSSKEQLKYLTTAGGFACAPSAFINRELLEEVGFADERFLMLEDSPLWFRILKKGEKIYFMNVLTVKYRIGNSISQSDKSLFNLEHLIQKMKLDIVLFKREIGLIGNIRKFAFYAICILLAFTTGINKTVLSKNIYRLALLIKPYWLREKITK